MLCDCKRADSAAVSLAVDRFRREFERWLGPRIEPAFRAFQTASEGELEELSDADKALALEFGAAYQAALTEGLAGLSDHEGAYFELRVT